MTRRATRRRERCVGVGSRRRSARLVAPLDRDAPVLADVELRAHRERPLVVLLRSTSATGRRRGRSAGSRRRGGRTCRARSCRRARGASRSRRGRVVVARTWRGPESGSYAASPSRSGRRAARTCRAARSSTRARRRRASPSRRAAASGRCWRPDRRVGVDARRDLLRLAVEDELEAAFGRRVRVADEVRDLERLDRARAIEDGDVRGARSGRAELTPGSARTGRSLSRRCMPT
jgi:hypothetical protein